MWCSYNKFLKTCTNTFYTNQNKYKASGILYFDSHQLVLKTFNLNINVKVKKGYFFVKTERSK